MTRTSLGIGSTCLNGGSLNHQVAQSCHSKFNRNLMETSPIAGYRTYRELYFLSLQEDVEKVSRRGVNSGCQAYTGVASNDTHSTPSDCGQH